MAWITAGYVKAAITTATYNAVAPSTAVFTQFEAGARAHVSAVLQYAGYSSPGDSLTAGTHTTAFLQRLALGVWCRDVFAARKGIKHPLPEAAASALSTLEAVYEKKLPVPGGTPSTRDGYSGGQFSPTNASSTDGRPQQFSRSKLSGF